MTQLRERMLEELEHRNYSPGTAKAYLFAVKQFAEHFHRAPDRLGAEHIREHQLYLFRERKLAAKTVGAASGRAAVLLRQDAQATSHAGAPPPPQRLTSNSSIVTATQCRAPPTPLARQSR
jgi:hypothetical protein